LPHARIVLEAWRRDHNETRQTCRGHHQATDVVAFAESLC
jgi:hypothetical protein